MKTEAIEEIKKVIMFELPGIMKSDPEIRKCILSITRESYSDRTVTESRFDRIMDELQHDREARDKKWEGQDKKWAAQDKKWDEERKAQDKKWAAQDKKWDEERKAQDKKWDEERKAQDKKWDEERKAQDKKWAAQNEKWDIWAKKWDEERKAQDEKWEAQDRKWDTWTRKWDEERKAQDKKWEENQRVINEILDSIKKLDKKHDATIGALGARWGLHSESAFRKGLRAILEGSFGVKVERYEGYDREGTVFGRPEQIELDVIVHNGTLILCEIKSSMSKSELYTFWRKKNFYEEKHARKADRVMVISPMIDAYALSAAENLDIETFGYAEDVKT